MYLHSYMPTLSGSYSKIAHTGITDFTYLCTIGKFPKVLRIWGISKISFVFGLAWLLKLLHLYLMTRTQGK